MDGASIHNHLFDRSKGTLNFFEPSTFLVGLFLFDPTRTHLEQFVKSALLESIERALNLQSVVRLEIGAGRNTECPIELGLEKMFAYASALSGTSSATKVDPCFKQVLDDLVEEEALRLSSILSSLRTAGLEGVESMPDRIEKARALGELAAQRYLTSSEDEGSDLLNEASLHLKEVLEQPVGQRDPFTWLLFGWVNYHLGHLDHTQHSYLQSCLACGSDRKPLYFEANRLLAAIQVENGAPEVAYQTLSKSNGTSPDCSLAFDRARVCARTNRVDEVQEVIGSLASKWPLATLGAFGDPDLVRCIKSWLPAVEAAARELQESTRDAVKSWRASGDHVGKILSSVDSDLQLPPSILTKISQGQDFAAESDVLSANWLKSEADRGIAEVMDAGRLVLQNHMRSIEAEAAATQARIEKLKDWREQTIAVQVAQKGEAEQAERTRLGLDVGDDRAQAGCLMSSGVGCAGYAAYFVTCFLSTTVMVAAGPSTGIGKILLIALGLPVAFGILLLIADGTRRTMAQKELYRQISELSGDFDRAIEEVNATYREKLPPLTEDLKELRAKRDSVESTIRQLHSRPNIAKDAA